MTGKISWRVPALLCALLVLIVLLVPRSDEKDCVLGVPLITQEAFQAYQTQSSADATVDILFNGAAAAMDEASHTLYLPVHLEEGVPFQGLRGSLSSSEIGVKLYFAEDEHLNDPTEAISAGHRFRLAAENVWGEVSVYDVVFSTLPVVSLETITSEGEGITEFFKGNIIVRDPMDAVMQDYRVTQSIAEWHYRGRTTKAADKKSYRVSLKTKTGDRENNQFLDLGYDDDWILNAVVRDGTKLREPVISALWSQMQETNGGIGAMSESRYVELVCDGVFQGVYLLQRRIDGKTLNIGPDDVLIKGVDFVGEPDFWSMYSPEEFGDNLNSAEAAALTQAFYDLGMIASYETDSWIDVELLIQAAALRDNVDANNMYYWFIKQANGYRIRMIPWDVDMSFGYRWVEGIGFVLDADQVIEGVYHRREYAEMLALYPDLNQRLARRWMELREEVFTAENLAALIADNQTRLITGGALAREYELWAYLYDAEDTPEALMMFFENRLKYMDEYYKQFLS